MPKCSQLCAFIGLVLLGLWIAGRVLTDDYHWSQYLWWVPALWMIGAAWLMLIGSYLFDLRSRRMGGMLMRPVLLLASIGCTGYLIFGVWHVNRALVSYADDPDSIRVVHWNLSGKPMDEQGWAKSVFDQEVDIVLLANAQWGDDRQDILNELAPFAPLENERWINYSFKVHGEPSHFWIQGNAMIASRFPMVRSGMVYINARVEPSESLREGGDRGWVMFIEFDINQDEPLIVWFVDLPSDPAIWRQDMMRNTAKAIKNWNGQSWIMGKHVWERQQTQGEFPNPNLIIGDFNTPSGSASLSLLAPGMTDASERRGFGRSRSWVPNVNNRILRQPIKLADWHIDLALVGNTWKTNRYQIKNTRQWGLAEHRMQVLDISR